MRILNGEVLPAILVRRRRRPRQSTYLNMPRTVDDLLDEILQEVAYHSLGPSPQAYNALLLTNKRLNAATKAVADQ
jgi:hypothetical protein